MSNIVSINEVRTMATSVTKSGMFGLKNQEQAFTLMLIAQAEGIHPIQAVQKYSVINGMPSLKSTEIQSRFQKAGGKIKWIETTNKKAIVRLTHPSYDGEYDSEYSMEDAKVAGLIGKDNWKRMPKNMLRARAISEGVRAVYPDCLNNMYSDVEAQDMPIEEDTEEVEIIETSNIDTLKAELALKLRNKGLTNGIMKEFYEKYVNDENIEDVINNKLDELLLEFENGND